MSYPPARYPSYAASGDGSISRSMSAAGRGPGGGGSLSRSMSTPGRGRGGGGFENIPLGNNPSGSSGAAAPRPTPPWIVPGTRHGDQPQTTGSVYAGPTGFQTGQGGGGMGGSHHWHPGHPANEPGDFTCLGKIHCWVWLILVCILIGGSITVGVLVGTNDD